MHTNLLTLKSNHGSWPKMSALATKISRELSIQTVTEKNIFIWIANQKSNLELYLVEITQILSAETGKKFAYDILIFQIIILIVFFYRTPTDHDKGRINEIFCRIHHLKINMNKII